MSTTPIEVSDSADSCAVDGPCPPDTGCGCHGSAKAKAKAPKRAGVMAAIVAALCAAACLVVPLAAGGIAALTGALAGEWLIVAGAVLAMAIVGTVMVRRRGGSGC